MKKTLTFILAILLSSITYAQDCNIGNQNIEGFETEDFSANFLLGSSFELSEDGILHSVNLVGTNTGAQVQMAVFDDNNGVPNNLVASTGVTTVGQGVISLPVNPTQLSPGTYWVMAVYDVGGFHIYVDSDDTGHTIYYGDLNFGDPIPSTAAGFTSYSGSAFAYFLEIECGTTCNIGNQNIEGFETEDFSANFLLGSSFELNEEGILHSVNLVGTNTGAQVQMAVFDDNNGVPNNLVASTGITTVGQGVVSLPVTPTQLAPGIYWVMAVYDVDGSHIYVDSDDTGHTIYYGDLNFGDPIPSTAAGFTSYSGSAFAYFLGIECGVLAPGNDNACNATHIPADGSVNAGNTNVNATAADGEEDIAPEAVNCGTSWCAEELNAGIGQVQNSVWFTFTAPTSGAVEISTCDLADFDTQLALYSVIDCDDFATYALIGANDDGPDSCATNYDSWMQANTLTAGQIYYIMVDGYAGAVGEFGISVTEIVNTPTNEVDPESVEMLITPNPNNGIFNVRLEGLSTDVQMMISDATGKVVHRRNVKSTETNIDVRLPDLAKGFYFVQLLSTKERLTKKIMIE